jgi:kynurenine formamidase
MRRLLLLVWLVAGCRPASQAARPGGLAELLRAGTWVDLSYSFDSTTIYWPTAQPFRLEVVSAQRTAAGYYYAANNIAAAEHGGTHLDAPVHFAEGKHATDQIPLDQLIGASVRDRAADEDWWGLRRPLRIVAWIPNP